MLFGLLFFSYKKKKKQCVSSMSFSGGLCEMRLILRVFPLLPSLLSLAWQFFERHLRQHSEFGL